MKLLKCHIDNFGGLHDYDMHFDDGLNVVLHDNGWGKTTLATFIKAMIYGLDAKRGRDISNNERRKYLPWQGGKYGGSLDFESEGRQYRIYRTFGETPRFDKARIVDLEKNTTAKFDPDNLGDTLFKLDSSAFQRSVFINQNGIGMEGAAGSIHAKLNTLVSQANDLVMFDKAIDDLTKQIKVYEKTGQKGKIADISREILDKENLKRRAEQEIAAQNEARENIARIDAQISAVKMDLTEKKKKLEELTGEAKKKEAALKMLTDLNTQIAEIEKNVTAIHEEFGHNIPTSEEMNAVHELLIQQSETEKLLSELKERKEIQESEKTAILEIYGGEIPTIFDIDAIQKANGELAGARKTESSESIDDVKLSESYVSFAKQVELDPDYLAKVDRVILMENDIETNLKRIEGIESKIAFESKSWEETKKRHEELKTKIEAYSEKLKVLERFIPRLVDPVIHNLSNIEKRSSLLASQKEIKKAELKSEANGWNKTKAEYKELLDDLNVKKAEYEKLSKYSKDNAGKCLAQLKEAEIVQNKLADLDKDIKVNGLSDKEMERTLKYGTTLPSIESIKNQLLSYRENEASLSKKVRLEGQLAGEKSKADALKMTISQIEVPAEEKEIPSIGKSNGSVFMGAGAVASLVGIALAVVLNPVLAVLTIVGAMLIVLGMSQNSKAKKQQGEYQSYLVRVEKRNEILKKKNELAHQLEAVESLVNSLNGQIVKSTQDYDSKNEEILKWINQWKPEIANVSESSILSFLDDVVEITELNKKKQKVQEEQKHADELRSWIEDVLHGAKDAFAELNGSVSEMSLNLQAFMSACEIAKGKLDDAEARLKNYEKKHEICSADLCKETSRKFDSIQKELADIDEELKTAESEMAKAKAEYPEIMDMNAKEGQALLRRKADMYLSIDKQLIDTRSEYQKFIQDTELDEFQLNEDVSINIKALAAEKEQIRYNLDKHLHECNEIISAFGLKADATNVIEVLKRFEGIRNDYFTTREKLSGINERNKERAERIANLQKKVEEMLPILKGAYSDLIIESRLAKVRVDQSTLKTVAETLSGLESQIGNAEKKYENSKKTIENYIGKYCSLMEEGTDVIGHSFELVQKMNHENQKIAQLKTQRQSVEKDMEHISSEMANANVQDLRNSIDFQERRMAELLKEYQQTKDAIIQGDRAVEIYSDAQCDIQGLYEKKQEAQNAVLILKKTIELIKKAKANLADRYLNKVEVLFNSYLQLWSKNEDLKAVLDLDFNIEIEENSKVHDVKGYSTGYCDMIDFCMRMALVDTLFESEQPFLVMDDPFVNLDEERLEKAMELMEAISATKQIVYFVCHPIRALDKNADQETKERFEKLAEETKKMLEERKANKSIEKKAIAKPVRETYHISTKPWCSVIQPVKRDYVITNSIFSMKFELSEDGPVKDVTYELFFIDNKGHVLNDRQTIECIDGSLSSSKVLFNLNTREDSGNVYELVIHEKGKDDFEVMAKYPFNVKLAFTGTSSFDF